MVARFSSDVPVPSFQASWQDGSDQGAFYWPYFYGMAIVGMDIIPTLTFQMLPVMKPFLARLGGRLAIQNQFIVAMLKFLYLYSSQVASCSNSNPPLPLSKPRTTAGLGGSTGCPIRLETRRSRVQPPPRSATFCHGD